MPHIALILADAAASAAQTPKLNIDWPTILSTGGVVAVVQFIAEWIKHQTLASQQANLQRQTVFLQGRLEAAVTVFRALVAAHRAQERIRQFNKTGTANPPEDIQALSDARKALKNVFFDNQIYFDDRTSVLLDQLDDQLKDTSIDKVGPLVREFKNHLTGQVT